MAKDVPIPARFEASNRTTLFLGVGSNSPFAPRSICMEAHVEFEPFFAGDSLRQGGQSFDLTVNDERRILEGPFERNIERCLASHALSRHDWGELLERSRRHVERGCHGHLQDL